LRRTIEKKKQKERDVPNIVLEAYPYEHLIGSQ
jgi:hypothetical protein